MTDVNNIIDKAQVCARELNNPRVTIPVVAYLKQYLDGSARKPGVHLMGYAAEPIRLFEDMQKMGALVSINGEKT